MTNAGRFCCFCLLPCRHRSFVPRARRPGFFPPCAEWIFGEPRKRGAPFAANHHFLVLVLSLSALQRIKVCRGVCVCHGEKVYLKSVSAQTNGSVGASPPAGASRCGACAKVRARQVERGWWVWVFRLRGGEIRHGVHSRIPCVGFRGCLFEVDRELELDRLHWDALTLQKEKKRKPDGCCPVPVLKYTPHPRKLHRASWS